MNGTEVAFCAMAFAVACMAAALSGALVMALRKSPPSDVGAYTIAQQDALVAYERGMNRADGQKLDAIQRAESGPQAQYDTPKPDEPREIGRNG